MKTAFVIPGFNISASASDSKYVELKNAIKAKGYKVVPVSFAWNRTTISQYADKFVDFYNKYKGTENVVVGNSYGAMVTFLTTPILKPNRAFLCSLSPFFKEDLHKHKKEQMIRRFGKRRVIDMETLSAAQTAKQINSTNTEVILFYGEQEKKLYPSLVSRAKNTASVLRNGQVIEIPDAPHSFRNSLYIQAITKTL